MWLPRLVLVDEAGIILTSFSHHSLELPADEGLEEPVRIGTFNGGSRAFAGDIDHVPVELVD